MTSVYSVVRRGSFTWSRRRAPTFTRDVRPLCSVLRGVNPGFSVEGSVSSSRFQLVPVATENHYERVGCRFLYLFRYSVDPADYSQFFWPSDSAQLSLAVQKKGL